MDISQVLTVKYPGTSWILVGNDYMGLSWTDNSPKPTESELLSQWSEVQTALADEAKAKEDARVSALAKLAKLGLTPEEVAAITS